MFTNKGVTELKSQLDYWGSPTKVVLKAKGCTSGLGGPTQKARYEKLFGVQARQRGGL